MKVRVPQESGSITITESGTQFAYEVEDHTVEVEPSEARRLLAAVSGAEPVADTEARDEQFDDEATADPHAGQSVTDHEGEQA